MALLSHIKHVVSQTFRCADIIVFPVLTLFVCAAAVFGIVLSGGCDLQAAWTTARLFLVLTAHVCCMLYIVHRFSGMEVTLHSLKGALMLMLINAFVALAAVASFGVGLAFDRLSSPRLGSLSVVFTVIGACCALYGFIWVFMRSFALWRVFEGAANWQSALREAYALMQGHAVRVILLMSCVGLVTGIIVGGVSLVVKMLCAFTTSTRFVDQLPGYVSVPMALWSLLTQAVRTGFVTLGHAIVYRRIVSLQSS